MAISSAAISPLVSSVRVPTPIRWLLAADVGLMVLAVLNAVVATMLGIERSSFLRTGAEANLPTWYATIQLALVALVLLPLAIRDVQRADWRTWGIALGPALFAVLSLDEAGMLHERLGLWMTASNLGSATFVETAPWLLALAPVYFGVALAALHAWRPYLQGERKTQSLLVGGVLLLGASAAGLEALMYLLGVQHSLWGQILSVVEEAGELVAVTLILWGALRLVLAEGIRVDLGTGGSLGSDERIA